MGLLSQTPSQYYNSSNSANYGDYQFVTLESIINAFMYIYVGESKIISKVSRTDVQFHAMRAVQELSYDVLKSFKSQEIEVPNTLSMILPQDYVNYVKLARVGNDGIERVLYPARKTSDPFAITQDSDGVYQFDDKRVLTITVPDSSQIADGDYLQLLMQPADGSAIDFTTGEPTGLYKAYFIFNTDSDNLDTTEPDATEVGPNFFVDLAGVSIGVTYTANEVAVLLAQQINLSANHTAVVSGNTIKLTYNNALIFSTDALTQVFAQAFSNGATITTTSGIAEGFLSAGTEDTAVDSAYQIVVTNTGLGGNTITEQVPSNTSENFQSQTPVNLQAYDINYTTDVEITAEGRRYGLDPQFAQMNGSFFIDQLRGLIKFSSDLAGETITLHYVSDGLGTDAEMVVHKFCEEACYKHIAYGILSTRSNIPPFIIQRFKKEKFAETRKAKIRLSNIKIEEFTQVLKGMGKQIK